MPTKRIVPRASGEGGVGRPDKLMGPGFFSELGLSGNVRLHEATLVTTTSTPTAIWLSGPIVTGQALLVLAMVVGADAGGSTFGSYARLFSVHGSSTGPALKGTSTLGRDVEVGSTAMNVTGGISGNALVVSVTGRSATTMYWRAFLAALYRGV